MRLFPLKPSSLTILLLMTGTLACSTPAPAPTLPRLDIAGLAFRDVIPGPPTRARDQKKDTEEILRAQRSRTPADCARAKDESQPTLAAFFGGPHGPLTQAEVAQDQALFDDLLAQIRPLLGQAKDTWKRPRPYAKNPAVRPCLKPETSSSYPSGHAVVAAFFADVLSERHPEKREKIQARAAQLSHDRVLSGLHYPSDTWDGEKLGHALAARLKKP